MENLKALVYKGDLTPYQRALAQREFKDLAERLELLEKAVKNNAVSPLVSRSLLLKIVKDLGDTKRQFLLWHDGGEWIVSLNGDMKQCKTLSELVCRNDG